MWRCGTFPLLFMIQTLKRYIQQVQKAWQERSIFAVLGSRVYPATYLEEVNEQCRIFFPLYAAPFFVAWLPYLAIDPLLFPNEPLFAFLRVGLTVTGCLAYLARKTWNHPAKHRFISVAMLYYLIVATGVLTGLSKAHPSYIGGYCFIITVLGAMPVQLFHLYMSLGTSLLTFAAMCFFQNIHFDTPALQYSLQDLISTVGVTILLSYGWSILRRNTYAKGRALQESNERIHSQHHELEEQNQALFTLNNEKDELLGIVSHDLKNPLAGMKGVLEILRTDGEKLPSDFRATLLTQVNTGVERMFGIVTNLLDMNRLESGSVSYAFTKLDAFPIVEEIVQFYKESALSKQLHLYVVASKQSYCILADKQALKQILDNLVSNAVKYSPHGKTITIDLREAETSLQILIQDEGEGISRIDQERLFTKFARLSAQPTGGEHSTGLGLSIVKKLAEAMNGDVWCESEIGEGSTFIVELPRSVE